MDRQQVMETASHIRPFLEETPAAGYLTGTGLADTLASLDVVKTFPYDTLPHFPKPTVESHRGRLVYGMAGPCPVLVMQGRFHLYEGYTPQQVTFPVRVFQELGVGTLILSNAAGGINLNFAQGDIMVIQDHINLTGCNPLAGPNEPRWGIRFPDMCRVYDPGLIRLAASESRKLGIHIKQGVYAGLTGPSLETPAETRYLKTIGGDAVGFSTVMEAIAGVHAGMKILGLSMITNINDPDAPAPTTVEAVIRAATDASPLMDALISGILRNLE